VYTYYVARELDAVARIDEVTADSDCLLVSVPAEGSDWYSCRVAFETGDVLGLHVSYSSEYASLTITGSRGLVIGDNDITIDVVAQNGVNHAVRYLRVTRSAPVGSRDCALLSSLSSPGCVFAERFRSSHFSLACAAPVASSLRILPQFIASPLDSAATWSCDETERALAVGPNSVSISVFSADGLTSQSYVLSVTRVASSDSTILAVVSDVVACAVTNPMAGQTSFECDVPFDVSSVSLGLVPTDLDAIVEGAGAGLLNYGLNYRILQVYAADRSLTQYSFQISRAFLNTDALLADLTVDQCVLFTPAFQPTTLQYTCVVALATDALTVVSPTQDPVARTSVLLPPNLPLGYPVNAYVTVIAQDSAVQLTYSLSVLRSGLRDEELQVQVVEVLVLRQLLFNATGSGVEGTEDSLLDFANTLVVGLDKANQTFFARFAVVGLELVMVNNEQWVSVDAAVLPALDAGLPSPPEVQSAFYDLVSSIVNQSIILSLDSNVLSFLDPVSAYASQMREVALVLCNDGYAAGLERCNLHVLPEQIVTPDSQTFFQKILCGDPLFMSIALGVLIILGIVISMCIARRRKLCCFNPNADSKRLINIDEADGDTSITDSMDTSADTEGIELRML